VGHVCAWNHWTGGGLLRAAGLVSGAGCRGLLKCYIV
jgi:hypothetical protein